VTLIRHMKRNPAREEVFDTSCFTIPPEIGAKLSGRAKELFHSRAEAQRLQAESRAAEDQRQAADRAARIKASQQAELARRLEEQAKFELPYAVNAPRGPAVKGLRLGEKLEGHKLAQQIRLVAEPDRLEADPNGITLASAKLTVSGRMKSIFLPKSAFKAQSIPFEEFARRIMESYALPSLTPVANVAYRYVDAADGWEVIINQSGVRLSVVVPSSGSFD
jgi:hypothetical protein